MTTPAVASTAEQILTAAWEWLDEGHQVALATVVSTWGSAPRRPGSMMCVRGDGAFLGSVSGGCVETAVMEEASAVLASGEPALLEYGVANDEAWAVGLACGGTVRVYVEALQADPILERLCALRDRDETLVLVRDLKNGERWLLSPLTEGDAVLASDADTSPGADATYVADPTPAGVAELVAAARDAARDAAQRDASGTVEADGRGLFLHVFSAPPRLIVVGAVQIAQHLSAMAAAAGLEVSVVDPRTTFASPDRFPGVKLVTEWPAEALAELGLDRRTGLVTVTHDPKLDDPALEAALRSSAFYIGALGSRRTHAARVERLETAGFDVDAHSRIHAPVGLDIGARTPGEIATSILAQVIQALRKPRARGS